MNRKVETLEIEDLRRLVQEGIDSGPALEADTVFAKLRARFGEIPTALFAASRDRPEGDR